MDSHTLFLRACRGEPVERVPVWLMRQAGRYLPEYRAIREKHSFLEVCQTPDLAAEVSLQPLRILGVDAVIVFSDILIPAQALGIQLELGDGGPRLGNPVRSAADVARLRDFDPERETRSLCDTLRLLHKAVGVETPVIGFAGAPWTLACYMVQGHGADGFPLAKQFLYHQPAAFRTLLDRIARNTASYLRAQIAAGAAAVQLFDTWAGELTRADYDQFALPATQQVIREVKSAYPSAPVILYSKGTSHLLESVARSGADVLSLDWRVGLDEARKRIGHDITLQGNVDPCVLLGPPAQITAAVQSVVHATGGQGHILNLGHGILPSTPVENARLFVDAAKNLRLDSVAAHRGGVA
jgi:uroporphyrinogen decarboxylase